MYKKAYKESWPIVFGYFIVSFAFGITCIDNGLPFWLPVLMSLFVYAGAAQFAFLSLFISGSSIATIVITTLFINLRHMLMSVYMSDFFHKLNMKNIEKIIYGTQLTDESFALHSSKDLKDSSKFYISFNMYCHLSWVLGSLCGAWVMLSLQQLEL